MGMLVDIGPDMLAKTGEDRPDDACQAGEFARISLSFGQSRSVGSARHSDGLVTDAVSRVGGPTL